MRKNRIERHRAALRVREGYWFAPKLYGFGATPVTWQGWAATALIIILALAIATLAPNETTQVALMVLLITGSLALIWAKADGGWRWRWGPED